MFKDKIFDLDSDRKIEVVFQCILNTVNFQYLRLNFAKPYEEFLLSSNHIQRMPLRSEELMKAGACDAEELSQLMEYSCFRSVGLQSYYAKMQKQGFCFNTATRIELRGYGFDLSDTLRFLFFCKQKYNFEQFLSIPVNAKEDVKAILQVDKFLLRGKELAHLEPQERCKFIAVLALEKIKLSDYFHRIDKALPIIDMESTPLFHLKTWRE